MQREACCTWMLTADPKQPKFYESLTNPIIFDDHRRRNGVAIPGRRLLRVGLQIYADEGLLPVPSSVSLRQINLPNLLRIQFPWLATSSVRNLRGNLQLPCGCLGEPDISIPLGNKETVPFP